MWAGLRKRVLAGECVYGTMIPQAWDPGAPTIFAAAGYDFVFIDMEDGNYSMETIADLLRSAKSTGIARIIRVLHLETFFISRERMKTPLLWHRLRQKKPSKTSMQFLKSKGSM